MCFKFCVGTGHTVFPIIKKKMGMNFPHVICISYNDSSIVIVKTEYSSRHVRVPYAYLADRRSYRFSVELDLMLVMIA